jgi:lipoprotein-anchoring transpeptidase ErfK/SrfK
MFTVSRRTAVAPLALCLTALFAAGACGGASPAADAPTDAVVAPETAPAASDASINARITTTVTVRTEPSDSAPQVSVLKPKTPLGSPTTVLVLDERDGWLQVSLPTKPNGTTGWMPRAGVQLHPNSLAVTVDRAQHHLVVTREGEVQLEAPVADGTSENPTPVGTFYVTDIVETDNAAGPYGPFALGLSAHSETLDQFGGGDGQVGLHGTNEPGAIGTSVSHGCVRVANDIIRQLVTMVPLGTPVTVV